MGVKVRSGATRTIRRAPCCAIHTDPSGASAIPFDPTKASGGAFDAPPEFSISRITLPSGVTDRTTLPCTSLNQSVPSGRQSGPSVNLKPPATFSIAADGATRVSNARSSRSIVPTPAGADALVATAAGGAAVVPVLPLLQPVAMKPANASAEPCRLRYTVTPRRRGRPGSPWSWSSSFRPAATRAGGPRKRSTADAAPRFRTPVRSGSCARGERCPGSPPGA
jgi:hypothetical protein